jgi:hypothetical protein
VSVWANVRPELPLSSAESPVVKVTLLSVIPPRVTPEVSLRLQFIAILISIEVCLAAKLSPVLLRLTTNALLLSLNILPLTLLVHLLPDGIALLTLSVLPLLSLLTLNVLPLLRLLALGVLPLRCLLALSVLPLRCLLALSVLPLLRLLALLLPELSLTATATRVSTTVSLRPLTSTTITSAAASLMSTAWSTALASTSSAVAFTLGERRSRKNDNHREDRQYFCK